MAFKLKLKNVHRQEGKKSPFKQNQALIMGAGDASSKFKDLQGGFNFGARAASPEYFGGGEDDEKSTSDAEDTSKQKACSELGLLPEQLEACNKEVSENWQAGFDERQAKKAKEEEEKKQNEITEKNTECLTQDKNSMYDSEKGECVPQVKKKKKNK